MQQDNMEVEKKFVEWDATFKEEQRKAFDQVRKYEAINNNLKKEKDDLIDMLKRKEEEVNEIKVRV